MFSVPQYTSTELQQYNYFVMQEPVFEEKIEEPVFTCVYEENGVLYCASSTSERGYYYTYVLNNPLKYVDPTGYETYLSPAYMAETNHMDEPERKPGRFDFPDWLQTIGGGGSLITPGASTNNPYDADPDHGRYFDPETGEWHQLHYDPVSRRLFYYGDMYTTHRYTDKNCTAHIYKSRKKVYISQDPDMDSGEGENERLYDLSKSDVEGLFGATVALGVVSAAAVGNVPAVLIGTHIASGVITTVITADAYWDYQEIPNPQPSDKAKLGLNLINYGISIFFDGWDIPSVIIGVIDMNGGLDKFYERFNKKKQ